MTGRSFRTAHKSTVALMSWAIGGGASFLIGTAASQNVAPATAPAQTPAVSTDLSEIVVTALKQVVNVQSVPATVEVVSAGQLATAGITNFADLPKVIPEINISGPPTVNQFAVTMRGLGTEPGNPSFDSSVATYVNNAFISKDREFAASMFDMSSIEAISGTQAALLGKNSSLGAINLVTTKPGDVYEVDARYQHEFKLGSDRVEAGFDVPLSSVLKFRVAGLYDDEGGPVQEVITGQTFRDQKYGGRVTAVWTPSDKIDITALFQDISDFVTGPNTQDVVYGSAPNLVASNFGYPNTIPSGVFGKIAQYSPGLGLAHDETLHAQLADVTANFHLSRGTLTSQTSYSASRTVDLGNYSYLPGNAYLVSEPDNSKQFTQELRYASPVGTRIDYIAGLFYFDNRYTLNAGQAADYPVGSTLVPFPITGASNTYFEQVDKAFSGFSQGNFTIIDPLKLTAGVRYTNEYKKADFSTTEVTPGIYSEAFVPPVAPFFQSLSEGNVDGSIGLNYTPTGDTLFYATWGQGTKAGGYAATVSDLQQSYYRPETAQTAELGFKTQFFDRTLTVNGDVFDTYVRNFQVVIFNGLDFVVFNQNVRSDGFEFQIASTPVPGLRFYWNNIYANARDADTGVKVPYSPRFSGLVGGSYQYEIFPHLQVDLDINVNYRSDEIAQAAIAGSPYVLPPLAELHSLNVSLGIGDRAQGWQLRLIAQNLTDQHLMGFNFPLPFVASPAGTQNMGEVPLNPLTIKLQTSYKW